MFHIPWGAVVDVSLTLKSRKPSWAETDEAVIMIHTGPIMLTWHGGTLIDVSLTIMSCRRILERETFCDECYTINVHVAKYFTLFYMVCLKYLKFTAQKSNCISVHTTEITFKCTSKVH